MGSTDAPETVVAQDRSGSLGRFAAKTFTVVAAVTIGLWIIIGQVFDRIDDTIDSGTTQLQTLIQTSTHISGRSFWTRVEKELDKAASPASDLPPERKQRLLADIRILADRYRPFVNAAALLFSENPAEPVNKPK